MTFWVILILLLLFYLLVAGIVFVSIGVKYDAITAVFWFLFIPPGIRKIRLKLKEAMKYWYDED